MRPNTKLLFAETPTNPLTDVCDIRALADLAHARGRAAGGGQLLLHAGAAAADRARRGPASIHSGTKYLDGQGRVMAGAICGREKLIDDVFAPVVRTAGMTLSPFNAWVVLKGLETLGIRMQAQCASALALARWLEQQPQVERVYYPGLESHPQHALAMAQQSGVGGAVVSFVVRRQRRRPRAQQRLPRDRQHAHLLDHRQPGRHQDHHHPPGQHLARAPHRRAAPGGRHQPGHDPRGRRPRTTSKTSKADLLRGLDHSAA